MKYCRKCGNALKEGATFCSKCGEPVPAFEGNQENKSEYMPKIPAGGPKKKGNAGLIIAVCVAVTALIAAGIVFFVKNGGKKETATATPAAVTQPATPAETFAAATQPATQQVVPETEAETEEERPAATYLVKTENNPVSRTDEKGQTWTGYTTSFCGTDSYGNVLWEYKTGFNYNTELDPTEVIGLRNGLAYFTDNGTLMAADAATGEVRWISEDVFPASQSSDFDNDGNLYITGYYLGSLYKVDPNGRTVFTAPFGGEYGWPYQVKVNGTKVDVKVDLPFEATLSYNTGDGSKIAGSGDYQTMFVVNCNEFVTLRSYPSTKADALDTIPLGSPVSFIEISSDGFYKVAYLGQTGFVLASYLSTERPAVPAVQPSTGSYSYYQTLYVVNCVESITLRPDASTKSGEICQIPLGASVTYIQDAPNGFLKVIYLGKTGYALASYLSAWR